LGRKREGDSHFSFIGEAYRPGRDSTPNNSLKGKKGRREGGRKRGDGGIIVDYNTFTLKMWKDIYRVWG